MSQKGERSGRTFPLSLLLTIGAVAFVGAAGFLTWYLGFRDTWESDNAFRIKQLSEDAVACIDAGHHADAIEKHDQLQAIIGDHKIAAPQLESVYAKAVAAVGNGKRKADQQRLSEENRQREAMNLSQVARFEGEADSQSKGGDLEGAIALYDRALVIVTTGATSNPAFASAKARITSNRERLTEAVAERAKQVEAAKALAQEEKRLASIQAKLRGGAWVTKKAGNSEPLRGLELYIVRRSVPVSDTVAFARANVRGARSRLDDAEASLVKAEEYLKNREAKVQGGTSYADWIDSAKRAVEPARKLVESRTTLVRLAEDRLANAEAALPTAMTELDSVYRVLAPDQREAEVSAWAALVAKHLVANPHADVDGKYEADLHGGRFYVYASFASSYSSISWFLPLDVLDAQEQQLDLRNSNADEIVNKTD